MKAVVWLPSGLSPWSLESCKDRLVSVTETGSGWAASCSSCSKPVTLTRPGVCWWSGMSSPKQPSMIMAAPFIREAASIKHRLSVDSLKIYKCSEKCVIYISKTSSRVSILSSLSFHTLASVHIFPASVTWSMTGMRTKVPWLRLEFRFAGFAQISVWWKDKVGNILQDCPLRPTNEDVNMLTLAVAVSKTTTSGTNR